MIVCCIYPNEREVNDTTDSEKSASYLDFHLEIDNEGSLKTKLYDKRDDFNFPIVNFPFNSSNNSRITIVWRLHFTTHTFFGRHHDLVDRYEISISQMTMHLLLLT